VGDKAFAETVLHTSSHAVLDPTLLCQGEYVNLWAYFMKNVLFEQKNGTFMK